MTLTNKEKDEAALVTLRFAVLVENHRVHYSNEWSEEIQDLLMKVVPLLRKKAEDLVDRKPPLGQP